MSRGDVVGDSIDPSPETAAFVERSQTPPNGDVDFLKEIALTIHISFVDTSQSGQGSTVGINRSLVQLIVDSHRRLSLSP